MKARPVTLLAFSVFAILFGAQWGCNREVFRRHVFPNGFVGTYCIVMEESANPMKREGKWLVVEFDREGVAYMNKTDEEDYRNWGTDEFRYENGDPIVTLTPGTTTTKTSAAGDGSRVSEVDADLDGKEVRLQVSYIAGRVYHGPMTMP